MEEIVQTKPTEEDASGGYLAEKMPEKPASQPSSGGNTGGNSSQDDIRSKLSGLGASNGMGGMTNGGQAQVGNGSGKYSGIELQ